MKHQFLFIFALLNLYCLSFNAQNSKRPDWVERHPVNEFSYVGVGMAKLSESDYQQKAKQKALSELVSEIKVEIATNSLLNTLEEAGEVKQTFSETVRATAKAEIENFRLVDSWKDEDTYWVYYELNKTDYATFMEERRQKAIRDAFDFWYKGNVVLREGDLTTAIDLFSKGMATIQPVINQELFCSYDGKTINLSTELYASLAGVFNGISIVLNPSSVACTPFQGVKEPIAVGVYKDGYALKNIRLNVDFVSGSGDLSSMDPTNINGVTALYIRNVTSKQSQQQIKISLANDVFKAFQKGAYAPLFKRLLSSLPEGTLTVNTEQTQVSAYVKCVQNDMDLLNRNVKSLLSNNFFNIVESPSQADVTVVLDNKCRKGKTVPGELYNFVEFFSTLGIKITNNRTGQTMLNYSINDERTLVPESKSASQGMAMATRGIMKRLNREFNRELKKITFSREGKILEQKPEQTNTPIPVILPSEPDVKPTIPASIAVPDVTPTPLPEKKDETPQKPQRAKRIEWIDGIFVEFEKITSIGDKSRIHLKVTNTNSDDFVLVLYPRFQLIVNEKGEEKAATNLRIGSKADAYFVKATIVPNLPTEVVIEAEKLKTVALLQLKDINDNVVKLRNLE